MCAAQLLAEVTQHSTVPLQKHGESLPSLGPDFHLTWTAPGPGVGLGCISICSLGEVQSLLGLGTPG